MWLSNFFRSKPNVNVQICYKNFAAYRGISHIGLGVTAVTNSKVLGAEGTRVTVKGVVNNIDIVNNLKAAKAAGDPITHLVIQAPWLSTYDLTTMAHAYPETKFVVVSHSNFGFLQADPSGMRLLREAADLSHDVSNFYVAGNSRKFVSAFQHAFHKPMKYLPNLYYLDPSREIDPRQWNGGILRIGCFGAVRPLKNTITAAAAALQVGRALHTEVEFWISGGRFEGGGDVCLRAVAQMYAGLPNARLVQAPWRPWGGFTDVVNHMHLLMQVSYTESFNMVTADGISVGVPSVVSDAIDWAPDSWKAMVDDVDDVARVGLSLIDNPGAVKRGIKALKAHNAQGTKAWNEFLGVWRGNHAR